MTAAVLAGILTLLVGARFRLRPMVRRPLGSASPAGRRWRHRSARRRRPRGGPAELAVWCEALARAARGGATLVGALRGAPAPAHVADEVAPMMLAVERGTALRGALDRRVDDRDLGMVIAVLRAIADSGAPPAEPLDRVATALRARAADREDRRTQSAQARASAAVMTILPIATLSLLVAVSPSVRAQLATPLGAFVVAAGLGLNGLGWWWMRLVIARSAS